MKVIADLHIHSKYSRACSQNLDLPHLDYWAKVKGIQVMGTGDFTHPAWFKQCQEQLAESSRGLYRLKEEFQLPESKKWAAKPKLETHFLLTSEISCIYSRGGKVRRVHLLVFAPSLKAVAQINDALDKIGNLKADGRPILGLDAEKLTELVLKIDPDCMVVPAHAWTPWFAVFGSKSGFDSLEECFGKMTPNIFAIETGLSSDPSMNWRLSQLDKIALISNSDAHSLPNLGREANVFDLAAVDYPSLAAAIKEKDPRNFLHTLEFFPEEGKYHLDGHAACKVCLEPEETARRKGLCPSCQKPLTVGVLNRVAALADRPLGAKPENPIPYKNIVPLTEIIADALGRKKGTKAVQLEYENIIKHGLSELDFLLDLDEKTLLQVSLPRIAEGVMRVRQGRVQVVGGYDGVYGVVKIFDQKPAQKQERLI